MLLSSRPPFPSRWTPWDITPPEVSLANTIPVGQSFTWHRHAIPPPIKSRTPSSSGASSTSVGKGFFVKQEELSDSEDEKDFDEEACDEEWSKAIEYGGIKRIICLRQTREKIWFTSVLPHSEEGTASRVAAEVAKLDKQYLLELFQLPLSDSIDHLLRFDHPTYPSTPKLYQTFATLDPSLFHLTSTRIGLPQGIRVLRQDPFETLIAFITSSANNVGRITGLMSRLSERYGEEVLILGGIERERETDNGLDMMSDGLSLSGIAELALSPTSAVVQASEIQEYTRFHLFPTPAALLSDPDLEMTLRGLGFGYRASFISATLALMKEEHGVEGIVPFLASLRAARDVSIVSPERLGASRDVATESIEEGTEGIGEERWRRELLRFKGVGRKVADCIGLMCLDRSNVVPIDTHLQQIAARHPSFPARLKGKPTSGEKVYKEVQNFLTDLWGGAEPEQIASASCSSTTIAPDTKVAKRSPRKKRKIELDAIEASVTRPPKQDTSAGMGMAGWAQAVMFAADLKGSKAVKVEKLEIMENIKTEVFGGAGAAPTLRVKKELVSEQSMEAYTSKSSCAAMGKSQIDALPPSNGPAARLQSFPGFILTGKAGSEHLFGGKSDVQAIRTNSATHDVYNRLHSINKDMDFVEKVRLKWFAGEYPVVANQRCGSWYCDPKYAYFKSTDGHTNAWDFSVRRANLQLAAFAERSGGIVLVDSTRRGKRMPDALSKTVPIWCAVVNRAVFGYSLEALFPPEEVVSPTEAAQIMAKLPEWTDRLQNSSLTLPALTKPLRPYFIHSGSSEAPDIDSGSTPIICLSASTFDADGGLKAATTSYGSFEYIQGSGDDHELWGAGLAPHTFHEHRHILLSCPRQGLVAHIDQLLEQARDRASMVMTGLAPSGHATEIIAGSGFWLSTTQAPLPNFAHSRPLLITLSGMQRSSQDADTAEELYYHLGKGRKGDFFFSGETMLEAVTHIVAARADGRPTLIRDDDGKDVSVGLAVACLWHLYDDGKTRRQNSTLVPNASKEGVRRRLGWILDTRQGANPARKTLQRVNTFLISP